jgi:hypothetical protein
VAYQHTFAVEEVDLGRPPECAGLLVQYVYHHAVADVLVGYLCRFHVVAFYLFT